MQLDDLAEECERRVAAALAKIYRPSATDDAREWKKAIIDVFGEELRKQPCGLDTTGMSR